MDLYIFTSKYPKIDVFEVIHKQNLGLQFDFENFNETLNKFIFKFKSKCNLIEVVKEIYFDNHNPQKELAIKKLEAKDNIRELLTILN